MSKVTICENTLDPSTWETFEDVVDIRTFLMDHYQGKWPSTAHIYLNHVAMNADITPYDNAGIERLGSVKGHFFVVVYPAVITPLLVLIIVAAVTAVAIGLSFLLRPSAPNPPNYGSPNNALGKRENQPRVNSRIPDIYGTLWTTLDLIAYPYLTFVNNQEYEHCTFCIGRGQYQINTIPNTADQVAIRDDTTPLAELDNAQATVYAPNATVGTTTPQQTIGSTITDPIVNLLPFTGVNGQILNAPNIGSGGLVDANPGGRAGGVMPLRFINNGTNIMIQNSIGYNWETGEGGGPAFSVGDEIVIGGFDIEGYMTFADDLAADPAGIKPSVHLGVYDDTQCIYTVTGLFSFNSEGDTLALNASAAGEAINPGWTTVAEYTTGAAYPGVSSGAGASTYSSVANFIANGSFYIGPFWLNYPTMTDVWCNIVAPESIYGVDNTGDQLLCTVTVDIIWYPCDATGTPTAAGVTTSTTMSGNQTDRLMKGVTMQIPVAPGPGGILIMAQRTGFAPTFPGITPPYPSSDTWQDQIQWRDLYIICGTAPQSFGDVTIMQTVIPNTPAALAVRDRKINANVTRMVQSPGSDSVTASSYTESALAASNNAIDIMMAMALDPFIGNLTIEQIDVEGIYALGGSGGIIQTYFNMTPDATLPTQFCYTFDDFRTSFEEGLSDLAAAIFCVAYRQGGLLSLSFEQETDNSVLLFNTRNKLPGSEKRTVEFGVVNNYDGINLDYVEPQYPNFPNIDTTVTLYFPAGANTPPLTGAATNPKKVKTIGIRNVAQATVLGWRLYNKLLYQNTSVQFESTEESALLVLQDRILVADNTRSDTQDGEVIAQSSLLLTLSEDVTFVGGLTYSIFLQLYDGSVENIGITAGSEPNQVVLASAPSLALVTGQSNFAKTTYQIVSSAPTRTNAFLLSEKEAKPNKTWEIKAVNYDARYYANDDYYAPPPDPEIPSIAFVDTYFHNFRQIATGTGVITQPTITCTDSVYVANDGFGIVTGMCVDDAANIYILDTGGAIYKIPYTTGVAVRICGTGSSGTPITTAGPAITSHVYTGVVGIACDGAGNVYFGNGDTICCINMQSTTQTILGVSIAAGNVAIVAGSNPSTAGFAGDGGAATAATLSAPQGIAIDSSGNLWICDSGNHCIRQVNSSTGIIETVVGVGGVPGHSGDGYAYNTAITGFGQKPLLNQPHAICFDTQGNLYISCENSPNAASLGLGLAIYPDITGVAASSGAGTYDGTPMPGGISPSLFVGSYLSPSGFDNANDDFNSNPDYLVSAVVSGGVTLENSDAVNQTGASGLLVATFAHPAIRAVNLSGSTKEICGISVPSEFIVSVAGTPKYGYGGDGASALAANLGLVIFAITTDAAGNLYIADANNHRIRMVNTSGIISTYAGTGTSGNTGNGSAASGAEVAIGENLCYVEGGID
jgi:NHL repeat-containing protein